jgi:hypothetical protein
MKNTNLLHAFAFVFALGVIVGCVLFIVFQAYIAIMAVFGLIAFMSKAPAIAAKVFNQNKEKTNATNKM